MGYILNRFDKLMQLRSDPAVNEQFKLTAIIVHDPKDKNLIEHIRSHFLKFAEFTGKKFLFITFIQPPKEYIDAIRGGEYEYAKLLVSDSKQLSNTDVMINPLVRKYYGLPEDDSYLVLAKNFSDNEIFRVRITTGSLPYQLMDLTSYCNCPNDFDGLIKKLKAESFNINEMLGTSLLKIVSLISPSSPRNKYPLYAYPQRETAKKTIYEEKQKLIAALKQSSDDEDLTDKVLYIYGLIEYAYTNVFNEGQHPSIYTHKCENYKLLDGKSKKFWNTYSRLFKYLSSSRDELDYSAFILYLGKIVETELNLSVCQMLRQSMGIEMPDYYNKYCNKKGKVIIETKKQDVNLNNYDRVNGVNYLRGVALGDLLYAYKTVVEHSYRNDNMTYWDSHYFKKIPTDFLPLWENIAKKRNDAAHSRSVNQDSYDTTKKYFDEFIDKYFLEFNKIKEELRPSYYLH